MNVITTFLNISFVQLALVHKIIILGVAEKICKEALNAIKKNVAEDLIKLAVEEMVNTKVNLFCNMHSFKFFFLDFIYQTF